MDTRYDDGVIARVIDEAARQDRLGAHRAAFRPRRMRAAGRMIAAAVPVVAFLGIIGASGASITALLVVGVVGAGFLGLGYLNLRRVETAGGRDAELHVFEDGLVVHGPGGATTAYRWEELQVLRHGTEHRPAGAVTLTYTLLAGGRPPLVVGDRHNVYPALIMNDHDVAEVRRGAYFEEPGTWGPMIEEGVSRAQLPAALESIAVGRTLDFGRVSVSPDELTIEGTTYLWGQVAAVRVTDGVLGVARAGRRFTASSLQVSHIPNLAVLLAVVDRQVKDAGGQGVV